MEVEVDKLIKEKEKNSHLAMVPLDALPIASILQTHIPTSSTTAGASTSRVPSTSNADDSIELAQSMENMLIQGVRGSLCGICNI